MCYLVGDRDYNYKMESSLFPELFWKKDKDNEKEEGRTSHKKRKRVTDDKDEKNLWRVKCGTKKGWMDVEKLRKGKDCIEFEGSFYSPPEFEKLAGKDSCRKWKSSIYHKKAPLHFWFKKGYLTTTGYRQKKRKRQSSDLESQELFTERKEDHDEDEDGEEDDEDMDEDYVWDNEQGTKKNEDKKATQIYISSEEEESEEDPVEDEDEDGEQEDEHMDEDDVGNDERSTEDDEDEESDNGEDETVPAVASNHTDSSGIKERVTPTIPTPGKHALEMKEVKGIVNILPEKTRHHSDMPRSEVSGNNKDVAKNTAIKQQNVKKQPEEKLKKTTTSTISIPGKPALKMKEANGIVKSLPEKARHHPDTTRPEVIGNIRDVATNTAIKQLNVKKEPKEELKHKEDRVKDQDEDEEQEDEHMDEDDVGDDELSTEEDEDEESDHGEDETVPAVASNHTGSSGIKERVTSTIPTPGKHALEMKEVKGIVNILPEKTRHHPDMPRSEVSGNNRDVATNTAIKQQNVKQPEEKLKKTTTDTISTPLKPALKIKEVKGVVNSLPEKARHHPDMTRSEVSGNNRDVATNTAIKQQNVKKQPEEKLNKTISSTISIPGKPAQNIKEVKGVFNSLPEKARHHPDTTRSEVTENPRDVAKNTAIKQLNVKKQPEEELKKTTTDTISTPVKPALKIKEVKGVINSLPEKARHHPDTTRSEVNRNSRDVAKNTAIKQLKGPFCEPLAVSDDHQHKEVPCSGHSVAEVQSMRPEMSVNMSEARLPGPSASSGLNTMDLDQLKREKIKMEVKVLKLKEEYYTLKIKELKK
ncbi:DNA ligase 1-like isoform X2 [Oreochromis aureus]|uniref:DNA ligase 1-like isoform X2 n=1 Tax=Oreochromis aureus TaxID=47969 RepID=UPI0019532F22|nr:DNA ligase 1-like isoform X2 [Oreochromis aureus]